MTSAPDRIADVQAKLQVNAEALAKEKSIRSVGDQLADERLALLVEHEHAVLAANEQARSDFADQVPDLLDRTYGPLLQALDALDLAARDAFVAARVHESNVNDLKTQAQHLAAGATEGRIHDSRFGLSIDREEIDFEREAVAGAIAKSLEPIFRRLGQGVFADQLANLARSTPTLATGEQKDAA